MSPKYALLLVVLLAVGARGQQAGTQTSEYHPPVTTQTCTSAGCTSVSSSVVIDSNWRWIHNSQYTNCYNGNEWNTEICPDPVTCAASCELEGVSSSQYTGTYGITSSGSELTLGFVTGSNIGSRVYLMEDSDTYQIFNLKNREFAVDVDVSKLPCGLNGALYFVSMDADGGVSEFSGNKAGAKYGTGYCDAQCPADIKFINGEANTIDWQTSNSNSGTGSYGSCCFEMDIWEANSISNALTPHPCSVDGQYRCSGADCGAGSDRYNGVCDMDGCDYNPYRMGNQSFFGPEKIIDTTKTITVVTQFITSDNTDSGDLVEIRRFYKQGDEVFGNSYGEYAGVTSYNSISDDFCNAQKSLFGDPNVFTSHGGLQAMGEAMDNGLVLVMSLWDDYAADCLWLDSNYPATAAASKPGVARGSCAVTSGVPATVEAEFGSSSVTYANIKVGTIGSTTSGVFGPTAPSQPATQAPTQPATQPPTQPPTQPATQPPTQPATHAPTQPATQAPTQPATQPPTQPATKAPTQPPTQPATEAPTQPPTQPATEAPTEAPTSAPTQAAVAPTQPPQGSISCGGAPTTDCNETNIHISQSSVNSWSEGDDTVVQYGVFITTSCTTNSLVALTLSVDNWNPVEGGFWGFTETDGQLVLPSYISVTPATPLTWLGYQNIGGAASFSVGSYKFQ